MKNVRKLMATVCFLAAMLLIRSVPAQAAVTNAAAYSLTDVRKAEAPKGKWVKSKGGYRFRLTNNTYVKSKWIKVNKNIYYINSKGIRAKGWVKYRGNLYYMDKVARLKRGWITVGKSTYYGRVTGRIAMGKVKIGSGTYYFDPETGARKTGWVTIGKYQYYFQKNGRMKTSSWIKSGKKYYYVNASGKRLTETWLTVKGKKYYLDADGARVTGTQFIDGKGYYFRTNGVYDPKVKVKSEVDPKGKMVALTFDDGPGPYTDRLLNCLENNKAKATFFMVGSSVPSYKSTVKRMANMGCELGNHSFSHPAFTTLSYDAMRSQVTRTSQNIYAASGKYPTVFRLPYGDGASNGTVLSALGLPSIYWSIDTRDWANTGNAQHTIDAVLNNVQDGDIVLMHDIHQNTVKAAETIIPALRSRGYQLVTVSQLAQYRGGGKLQTGKTYYNFH